MKNKMKTALYCRTATLSDEAITVQEKLLRDYTAKLGYQNTSMYIDNGYNGLNFNRPAFMQLTDDIHTGTIDVVIAKDISRIGRNMLATKDWLNNLTDKGIIFISVIGGVVNTVDNIQYNFLRMLNEYCTDPNKRKPRKAVTSMV